MKTNKSYIELTLEEINERLKSVISEVYKKVKIYKENLKNGTLKNIPKN